MAVFLSDTPILNPLATALRSQSRWQPAQLFEWFLEDVLADLTGQRPRQTPPAEARPTLRELARRYAQAVISAPPFDDLLGPLFMDVICASDQRYRGQFFTPLPIARFMVELTVPLNDGKPPPVDRPWRVCEPACGSGVLLLALCQRLYERQGPAALRAWSLPAIDLDLTCAALTAAQLLVNSVLHQAPLGELIVYQGDALGPPQNLRVVVHQVATPTTPGGSRPVVPALHPARTAALKAAAEMRLDAFGLPMVETPVEGADAA